jgi:hypothetical protein
VAEFATSWSDYMMLQTLDYLSLQCCLGVASEGCAPVPLGAQPSRLAVRRLSPWEVELDPFPFPGTRLEVPVPYRVLSGRFQGQDDLAGALGGADEHTATTAYAARA